MKRKHYIVPIMITLALMPNPVFAMHIMEGFLPPLWCVFWGILSLPFLYMGYKSIKKQVSEDTKLQLLLAMAGAYAFVLSALKMPSVTGSSSHPTGIGLGTIMFGPTAMSIIGLLILIFQAVLLAHGGLTTLGANTFSMAIAGPLFGYLIYKLALKFKLPKLAAVFLTAFAADLFTYIVTSFQLAMAWPDSAGGFSAALIKYLTIFAVTQVPIAISEGILTVLVYKAISTYTQEGVNVLAGGEKA